MASTAISSMLVPPTPLNSPLIPFKPRAPSLHFRNDKLFIREISPSRGRVTAKPPSCSASGATAVEESIGIDALQRFIDLNTGNWTGSFHVSMIFSKHFASTVTSSNMILMSFLKILSVDFCSNLIVTGTCCTELARSLQWDLTVKMNSSA
nr:uncharacterized protein LOC109189147 [Ipomoea batatas]